MGDFLGEVAIGDENCERMVSPQRVGRLRKPRSDQKNLISNKYSNKLQYPYIIINQERVEQRENSTYVIKVLLRGGQSGGQSICIQLKELSSQVMSP